MANAVKRIGVLTSGGDAPGMNAAIRSVVRACTYMGIECVGIRRGYNGLINGDFTVLQNDNVAHIINRGGTMLYTARSDEFRTLEGQKKAAATCKLLGLDGIVSIGGDGSFRGLVELAKQGISVVGVPATIDNDIVCTDYTIGYDTAANTAVEAIDRLRDTKQSHERCSWSRSWAATRAIWRSMSVWLRARRLFWCRKSRSILTGTSSTGSARRVWPATRTS